MYWIAACSVSGSRPEIIGNALASRVCQKNSVCVEVTSFDVPNNLKFGTFDDLIRLVDELAKHDAFVESVIRRVERQIQDISGESAEFKIKWQFSEMSVDQYIRNFCWDDAKYPRTRFIRDNLDILLSTVSKLDEEVRLKAASFNEIRTAVASVAKKDASNLLQRDLIDVVTPDRVSPDDFVETEHLTTVCVVVPRGMEKDWLTSYETLENLVVPKSAKHCGIEDKDGNSLWRVILFRSALESFKVTARARRFICRDFTYSHEHYAKVMQQRSTLEAERARQEVFLNQICRAAFSDTLIAWIHLKALRVFVESVLRYGVPPAFAAFFLKLHPRNFNEKRLRQELDSVFPQTGGFGRSYQGGGGDSGAGDPTAPDGTEYYPYVSLNLVPLSGSKAGSGNNA